MSSIVLLAGTPALSQTADPDFLGTIVLDYSGVNEVGVDSDDLDTIEPDNLQDVFKNEPTVQVGSSLPISQKIYVNGIEENNLAVTIDGSRQNNKIFHHNATTYIDPVMLKQVRIDPGVAPADGGPGALAGSIAFETKDVDDLLAPGLSYGGIFSTEYQTNGDVFVNSLALMTRQGPFEALAYGKYATGDSQTDGDGNDILGSGTNVISGLAKVAYSAENGGRFELTYENVTDDDMRPFRADMGSADGSLRTRVYDLNRENIVFSYTTDAPTDMWDPKVLVAYSVTNLEVPTDYDASQGKTDSFNGVIQNRFSLPIGTVTAGVDFYSDDAYIDYLDRADPAAVFRPGESAENVGLFAQARLTPTDRMRISAGARGDLQSFTGTDGSSFDNSGLSANAAVEYDVTDAITLSAGASHIWGGITLAENFIMNPDWTYPADGIEPVTSENYFIAAAYNWGAWSLSGKVFKTDIDNARTPSYSGGPALTSDVNSDGYELKAGYAWQTGRVRIGFADIQSDVNGAPADSYVGRYLTTPIGQQVTLEVLQALPDYGLVLGADAQIAFDEDGFYDGAPADTLPGYQVVNAFVEYVPPRFENLRLRLQVNNLFDELYADRGTYGQEFVSDGLIPLYEPGRSVSVRATLTF
ncbi:TonB-dependent receptor [Marinibacterium profundimaris]|uniref:TonB-dependent receptor n=1 Tax=Marinibacterium profundimaris TaxID=1679460 RepID=A0A225NND1_9RHOB|nr:TonB-dependent receptor [Marinibacterium profundimaris]